MQELIKFIQQHALKKGKFVLSSGAKSSYYLDLRLVTLHPQGLQLVTDQLDAALSSLDFTAIGGPTLGADPIVVAYLTRHPKTGFLVRKESKSHGMEKTIEGPLVPGDKCVLVEDTVTTGNSLAYAVSQVREFGCRVIQTVSIVDRNEGAESLLAGFKIPYKTLIHIDEIVN